LNKMADFTIEQQRALALARARASINAVPEQGNMYTQSPEDIQYDANGNPLNTSSYGSGTTGATDYARKALTTATALPINVATGVAKNAGGLAQTVQRYFGGDQPSQLTLSDLVTGNKPTSKPIGFGEEMLNAINQIETGTQQQSGSPNLLKGASMVGQAAPYFATGGRIGTIPSFANTAKNVGQGALIGAGSALATPEEIGLTPEQFREAKNKNIGIQTALGGAFPIAGELVSKTVNALRGTKLSPQMQTAVAEARQAGYTVPPTQAGGGITNRLLEGLAGKLSTLQEASIRNQDVTNKLAARSLGLADDSVMTPELLKSIRDKAGQVYDNVSNAGLIVPKKSFHDALDKAGENAVKAEMNFPNETSKKILETIGSIRKDAFDAGSAISRIKQLRTEADIAYRAGNNDLGKATKEAATALENAIESHLIDLKQPDALNKFKEARQLIAKTYTIEKAMNPKTGSVDAKALATRLKQGKPMSGELKDIGEFGLAFPKASQMPEKIGGTIGVSPLDYAMAGTTGGISLLAGEDERGSALNSAIALGLRPAARKAVLSNVMQNRLVQQQVAPAGPISQALPSLDEAQQLAKMLIMQRSGSTSENKK
jgi:hypothetical protein